MLTYSKLAYRLLLLLQNGEKHSLEELSKSETVLRTQILETLDELIELGLSIEHYNYQFFQLKSPFLPLNKAVIEAHLTILQPYLIHVFTTIHSTNQFLKDKTAFAGWEICTAEHQTQGRGRFGRVWQSPFGQDIYLSLACNWDTKRTSLSGLSLIVGLAVRACLKNYWADITLKWPNDLWANNQKIGGVLIETNYQAADCKVIIGLGLNVNRDTEHLDWTSLKAATGQHFDRNILIAKIINSVDTYIKLFQNYQLDYFLKEWQSCDHLRDKWITIQTAGQVNSGYARGINSEGHLIIVDEQGKQTLITSGEASIGGMSQV